MVKYKWFGIISTLLSIVTVLVVLSFISSTLPILPFISIISPTWTDWSNKIKIPEIMSWNNVWSANPTPIKSAAEAAKTPVMSKPIASIVINKKME